VSPVSILIGTVAGAFSLDDPSTPLIERTRINHIARRADQWWALDGDGRVHHEADVVAEAPTGSVLNCIQLSDQTVWVGASEARLFRLETGLVEDPAFSDAPGRSHWYTPWGGPPDVRSMAVDAAGTLFVNVHVGGVLRRDDGAFSPTLDQSADVHQVIAHPDEPGVILAACALGLAQSEDGREFAYRKDGLHASYCRAVATVGETVLVSASTGPRTTQARLYRASLADGPFRPCTEGLPEWFGENLDSHCLAVREGVVYAGQGGTVWSSDDEGRSWRVGAQGLARVTCLA
jgi:hypothetical protein